MNRTLIHAPLALFLALLFSVGSGVEALGLTGCTHHGRAGSGHAGEMAHDATPAEHDGGTPHDDAPCLCFGACQSVAALPVVGGAAVVVREAPTTPTRPADPAREAPRIIVPHILPFANAPPLT